ncbi:MAG: protein-L-isoaspartate(D-aspartate) O-methyltransferase [Planctomycetota bacterium]|nr:protein-L-isoaspartate(D-aspartate) O-methyltransferase [Planctomycetota bacterium]
METARQPRLAIPIVMYLVAGMLVAAVIGWSVMVLRTRMIPPPPAGPALPPAPLSGTKPSAEATENPRHVEARRRMVEEQLRGRDIIDGEVLEVIGRIPRQRFVPKHLQAQAYVDGPLPIGHGQTISQPYIVALMTQAVRPRPESRVLDIGTGSGYQAAVLAELCKEVYSIEIIKPLAESARERLAALGYKNITVRCGDGYKGWPEKAPFDVIVVAAAPDHVPQPLVEQLAPGGRLVIPVGSYFQELVVIEKQKDGTTRRESIAPVMFVPMRGEAEEAGR